MKLNLKEIFKHKISVIYSLLVIFVLSGCGTKTDNVVRDKYPDGSPKIVETFQTKKGVRELIKQTAYYNDKKLQAEGGIKNNKMNGKWTYYFPNGKKWSEGYFKEGVEEGIRTTWFDNGNKLYEGEYKDGKRIGKWSFWDETGQLVKVQNY